MKEPKRYYCGNGEGMFEDDKNGHWVEYSEHKAIVETLTEQLRKHAVSGSLLERAASLVGNPGTNISGSTDMACDEWHKDYERWRNER